MISVMVIPNENESTIPYYHKEAESRFKHYSLLTDFCHKIGIKTTETEVYNTLLSKGCIVILTMFGNTVITSLPNNLSKNQCYKLRELKDYYQKFEYQEFGSWFNNDIHIFTCDETESSVDLFYQELDRIYPSVLTK